MINTIYCLYHGVLVNVLKYVKINQMCTPILIGKIWSIDVLKSGLRPERWQIWMLISKPYV